LLGVWIPDPGPCIAQKKSKFGKKEIFSHKHYLNLIHLKNLYPSGEFSPVFHECKKVPRVPKRGKK
jgi:hypothetical protein